MTRPRLFAELCCGSAAVTLRLLGGPCAKPPISYMGSKRAYAHAILEVLGLRSGEGADACLLCDPGPWSSVWRVLTQPDGCRQVAEVIRGWADEEPRALWERLRAERPLEGPQGVAQYLVLAASNRLINVEHDGEAWRNTGQGGTTHGGEAFGTDPQAVAAWLLTMGLGYGPGASCFRGGSDAHDPDWTPGLTVRGLGGRVSSLPWPATAIGLDAREVDPRDVAAWLYTAGAAYRRGEPWSGFDDAQARVGDGKWSAGDPRDVVPARLSSISWPPTVIHDDARTVLPMGLPEGCYVYIDPPYQGTTGYAHGLTREEVLAMALRWREAGAVVAVSEAEPLPLEGWHHVRLTEERIGQKRTFSRQQEEWLTMSEPPAVDVNAQVGLFGEAMC